VPNQLTLPGSTVKVFTPSSIRGELSVLKGTLNVGDSRSVISSSEIPFSVAIQSNDWWLYDSNMISFT
jgi:hypothetical protein